MHKKVEPELTCALFLDSRSYFNLKEKATPGFLPAPTQQERILRTQVLEEISCNFQLPDRKLRPNEVSKEN